MTEHLIDRRNLSAGRRLARAAVAAALLAVPFLGDQPLGLLSLLPLAAVYPGLTALLGYDPLQGSAPATPREAANDPRYATGEGERALRRAA